ncbi:hypothetical protein M406DRAFT_72892 [Cryphonectria parasitica EP155]|uniref:Uncharacterized protein n=1 Tax=Cryphonectria parasitica (strain ATCC 38755 / EP155) TaxID=660469 RepID=A0A9P5CMB6_CRYP1|nr:uncharacterized protein M406DRAFT_72892 [Cryphonectria parasitica EP155]KAF3762921.1 hypothetical protein M406DRAFT_72892 [Cryphonectria parasitica EP155]
MYIHDATMVHKCKPANGRSANTSFPAVIYPNPIPSPYRDGARCEILQPRTGGHEIDAREPCSSCVSILGYGYGPFLLAGSHYILYLKTKAEVLPQYLDVTPHKGPRRSSTVIYQLLDNLPIKTRHPPGRLPHLRRGQLVIPTSGCNRGSNMPQLEKMTQKEAVAPSLPNVGLLGHFADRSTAGAGLGGPRKGALTVNWVISLVNVSAGCEQQQLLYNYHIKVVFQGLFNPMHVVIPIGPPPLVVDLVHRLRKEIKWAEGGGCEDQNEGKEDENQKAWGKEKMCDEYCQPRRQRKRNVREMTQGLNVQWPTWAFFLRDPEADANCLWLGFTNIWRRGKAEYVVMMKSDLRSGKKKTMSRHMSLVLVNTKRNTE